MRSPSTTNATPRWFDWRLLRLVSASSPPPGRLRDPSRGRLAMAMAAIRPGGRWTRVGWLAPLGGAHLRSGRRWARLFAWCPEAVTKFSSHERCAFGLQLIARGCRSMSLTAH